MSILKKKSKNLFVIYLSEEDDIVTATAAFAGEDGGAFYLGLEIMEDLIGQQRDSEGHLRVTSTFHSASIH